MRLTRPIWALIGLLAVAGCGGTTTSTHTATAPAGGSFAWLSSGRHQVGAPGGAVAAGVLEHPSGWRVVRGDRGSVSFDRLRSGAIVGYLNATPRSGGETVANWARFRVAHNADEGDRGVHAMAAVTGRRIGVSRASCVIDDYRTSLSRFRELACLVARPNSAAVVLGAAPPRYWAMERPVFERAIADFVASR